MSLISHKHAQNIKRSHLLVAPAKRNARRRDARCSKVVRCSCASLGCVPSVTTGDVSTADLSTALDVSASTNSGPIWKHMGEPFADVLIANALVTCYLAYANNNTSGHRTIPRMSSFFPPNFTNYFPSRKDVTIPARRRLPPFITAVDRGSEYWVYHKCVGRLRPISRTLPATLPRD